MRGSHTPARSSAAACCAYCLIRGLRDTLGVVYLQRICVDLGAYRGAGVGMALLLRISYSPCGADY